MPWVYAQAIRAQGIHPKFSSITEEMIKTSMENGIAVRPYTVNKKDADIAKLLKINCSAFITDDPVKALKIKKQFEKETLT